MQLVKWWFGCLYCFVFWSFVLPSSFIHGFVVCYFRVQLIRWSCTAYHHSFIFFLSSFVVFFFLTSISHHFSLSSFFFIRFYLFYLLFFTLATILSSHFFFYSFFCIHNHPFYHYIYFITYSFISSVLFCIRLSCFASPVMRPCRG